MSVDFSHNSTIQSSQVLICRFSSKPEPVASPCSCACHQHSDPGGVRDLLWTSESCKLTNDPFMGSYAPEENDWTLLFGRRQHSDQVAILQTS